MRSQLKSWSDPLVIGYVDRYFKKLFGLDLTRKENIKFALSNIDTGSFSDEKLAVPLQ
jgi:hypothetical protein